MNPPELPDNWPFRPLSDPCVAAAVLDLVVRPEDRRAGAVSVVLCDPDDRLVQPTLVNHRATSLATDPERHALLEPVVALLEHRQGSTRFGQRPGGLLMGVTRADGLSISDDDLQWQRALHAVAEGRVRVLGVHLLTQHGSRPLPPVARAA
ncbi:MAG TPA: hypothetical protein VFL99_11465 [Segeticoccus sp.]|uniref:hypothetical protein n=1 Tax=Segeticoccus sp. TaxID=2706531 RepID=UPI002D7F1EDD|nr:hypothetical protein [Segeticoccus sp.]HET8600936.1 hypothetical protein [Segeticoccus sp.]